MSARSAAACALATLIVVAPPADGRADGSSLLDAVDALAREVSAIRGLPVRHAIDRDAVDKAELERRLAAMLDEDVGEVARQERLLAHWGFLPPNTGYRALLARTLADQVAGYYDFRKRRLTIALDARGSDDPAFAEAVLAHEIQHALQDQTFRLGSLTSTPAGEDDAAAAREALIEGDGVAVMIAVLSRRGGAPKPALDRQMATEIAAELVGTPEESLDGLPLIVRERMLFPYAAGLVFVGHLLEAGSWRRVDAALRRPPASTEQILHPELYDADERPLVVAPLAALAGAAISHETVWGEATFSQFLRQHGVPEDVAADAAAGWGGDRISIARTAAGDEIGVARLLWDTEQDAIEAARALTSAVDEWARGTKVIDEPDRQAWLSVVGNCTIIERRGPTIVLLHDAPLGRARRAMAELWRPLPTTAAP